MPLRDGAFRRAATCALLVPLVVSCRRPAPPGGGEPGQGPPPDRLAETEIAPGIERAFDLPLPRGARIDARFGASITASVSATPEALANFVRRHAVAGDAVVGPHRTVFPKVYVKGAKDDHWLRVEIHATAGDTKVVVDRVDARPPVPAGSTQDEIMKKAGLTPDGKLDPKKLD